MRRTKSNLSKAPLDFAGKVAYNEAYAIHSESRCDHEILEESRRGWAAFYLNHGINTNTPMVVDL